MGARLSGTLGGVEEQGRTDGGWKGVMQLWALPVHLPQRKRTVYGVHPRSTLWEEELGRVQSGGCLFVRSQLATIETFLHQEKENLSVLSLYIGAPLFSNSYYSSLFIFICSSTQHVVAPTFSPRLYSVPLILLPDYFGSDTQNGGGELRAGRQRVEAIFWQIQVQAQKESRLPMPSGQLRLHCVFYACALKIMFDFLIYCPSKPLGPLGLSNGIKAQYTAIMI